MRQLKPHSSPSCLCSQGSLKAYLITSGIPFDQNSCTESPIGIPKFTERLRGVIVSLQQEIVRHMPPELSRRIMKMTEEHAARDYGSVTELLIVEDD